jgi:hypothetical protein
MRIFTSTRVPAVADAYNLLSLLFLPVPITGCVVWVGKAILYGRGLWLAGFDVF